MSATVTDCGTESLVSIKKDNETLRKQLEKASTKNKDMEAALRQSREDMTTLLQKLTRIKRLETQLELISGYLHGERTHFEEAFIKIAHSP